MIGKFRIDYLLPTLLQRGKLITMIDFFLIIEDSLFR